MDMTIIIIGVWLAIAVVFGIVEAFTQGLTSIWFSGGAVAAAITGLITQSLLIQVIVFLAVSILLLAASRPLVKKHVNDKVQLTNSEALIGAEGFVLTDIIPPSTGQVGADGKIWTAAAKERINEGTRIVIKEIKGVTLQVEKKENE